MQAVMSAGGGGGGGMGDSDTWFSSSKRCVNFPCRHGVGVYPCILTDLSVKQARKKSAAKGGGGGGECLKPPYTPFVRARIYF